jgi:serine/threonine-protein kinase/endoribonuclease IRE1
MATVDGSIYARRRTTGEELWKFHADRPMVEVKYARERFKDYDGTGSEQDIMWMVEPSQEGAMYIFLPGEGGGLQKWDMTIKRLADEFSLYFDTTLPFVYTAEKRNTLYTLNATDGTPLKYFSSRGGGGIQDRKSCRKVDGLLLDDDDDECESTPTINLGRTEYTVHVQEKGSGDTVCHISYFEWAPNKRDEDLVGQYDDTLDNKYIYTRSDGSILALEHDRNGENRPNALYSQKFTTSPVVRIFDVVKPLGADTRETPLVILPQPVAPLVNKDTVENVFINSTEDGSFYALSELMYPSVTDGAKHARCYKDIRFLDGFGGLDDDSQKRQSLTPESLVGIHALDQGLERDHRLPTISGPAALEPPPTEPEPEPEISKGNESDEIERPGVIDPPLRSMQNYGGVWSFQSAINFLVIAGLCYFLFPQVLPSAWKDFWAKREGALVNKQQLVMEPTDPITTLGNATESAVPAPERKVRFAPDVIDDGAETGTENIAPGEQKADDLVVQGPVTEDGTEPTIPKKKKAHRGSRGGRKDRPANLKSKAKRRENATSLDNIVDGVTVPKQSMQPDAGPPDGKITDVDEAMAIQSIQVDTDRVLGYGSGGTTVYEGTFEGREVAVKRMLLQYYDLASQEIKLLSQSDDHPNVVRYYRHEKDKDFL